MNDYKVLTAFENHAAGDVIRLHDRQAKYWLLSGKIVLHTPTPTPKTKGLDDGK